VSISLVYASSERSMLVSESSAWKGSAGAGNPVEGRLKEGVAGPGCLNDPGDEAELDG
jgi:hypothetical protein